VIRILYADLPEGLGGTATEDAGTLEVTLSSGLAPWEQQATLATVLGAARRAGWLPSRSRALLVAAFAVTSTWSAARQFIRAHERLVAVAAATAVALAGAVIAAVVVLPQAPPAPPSGPAVAAPLPSRENHHPRRAGSRTRVGAVPGVRQTTLPAAAGQQAAGVSSPAPQPVRSASPRPSHRRSASPSPSAQSSAAGSPQPSLSPSPSASDGSCLIILGVRVCLGG
jgi:cobalamin biosynthesis Mg chelatase CobN